MTVVGATLKYLEEFSNKFHHITTLMGNVKCRSNLIDRQNVLRRLHNINLTHVKIVKIEIFLTSKRSSKISSARPLSLPPIKKSYPFSDLQVRQRDNGGSEEQV